MERRRRARLADASAAVQRPAARRPHSRRRDLDRDRCARNLHPRRRPLPCQQRVRASPRSTRPALDSRFDVQVRQSLPFMDFSTAKWEMLLGVRNFFREAVRRSVDLRRAARRPPAQADCGRLDDAVLDHPSPPARSTKLNWTSYLLDCSSGLRALSSNNTLFLSGLNILRTFMIAGTALLSRLAGVVSPFAWSMTNPRLLSPFGEPVPGRSSSVERPVEARWLRGVDRRSPSSWWSCSSLWASRTWRCARSGTRSRTGSTGRRAPKA